MAERAGPAGTILTAWKRLGGSRPGRWLFARMLGRMIPYTGTIGASVLELGPGHCRVAMRDRRRVRNHLRSIHAVALANLGEVATGLAFNAALPAGARAIVTALTVDYLKKARGELHATCDALMPSAEEEREHRVTGDIVDAAGDVVARVTATWRVRPAR